MIVSHGLGRRGAARSLLVAWGYGRTLAEAAAALWAEVVRLASRVTMFVRMDSEVH